MILNNEEKEQAGLLAAIMDFINRQDKEALIKFFNSEISERILSILKN